MPISLREPSELYGGVRDGLLSWLVDRSLPLFEAKRAVDFEVLAHALDDLHFDVVEGCSARNEILGSLLIAEAKLYPFIAAEVICYPTLTSLVFTTDPVAKDLALIGVALRLHYLPVLIETANAA